VLKDNDEYKEKNTDVAGSTGESSDSSAGTANQPGGGVDDGAGAALASQAILSRAEDAGPINQLRPWQGPGRQHQPPGAHKRGAGRHIVAVARRLDARVALRQPGAHPNADALQSEEVGARVCDRDGAVQAALACGRVEQGRERRHDFDGVAAAWRPADGSECCMLRGGLCGRGAISAESRGAIIRGGGRGSPAAAGLCEKHGAW